MENETRDLLDNYIVTKQEGLGDLDPNKSESYSKYNQNDYAPTLMHNEALNFYFKTSRFTFFFCIMLPPFLIYHYKHQLNGLIIIKKSLVKKLLTLENHIIQIKHQEPLMLQ